jgi:DNA polymerase-3 subunit epsilon
MVALIPPGDSLNHEQLGLGLFPDLPPEPQPTVTIKKRMTRAPKAEQLTPAVPAFMAATDAETMALALEQHPDYRVQRRLQPRLQWPGDTPQSVTRVVVLDTETTGLDQAKEAIIELALLRVDIDNATGLPVGPVQVYDGLEDPGKPIPKEAVAITGITDADVQGKRLDEVRVAELLAGADLIVAHNAGFDRPFVEARLPQFAQFAWACSFADIDWKAQGRGSAKLEMLAQALGLFYDAHRAEMDCHALLAVLAASLPTGGGTGMAQLLRAAQAPSFRLSATNAPFDSKDLLKARGYRWNADKRVWHTRLGDDAALQAELAWLKENAYNNRSAAVQVEKMDSRTKYSARPGVVVHQQL